MKLKNSALTAVLIIFACLLPGCAGQDVSRRSMVTVLELEALPQGWSLTVEYLKKTSAEEEQLYGIYQGEGRTYLEAIQRIEAKEGDILYLDSAKCLILEGIESKEELESILLEVDRDGRVRPHVQILIGAGVLEEKTEETVSVGQQAESLMSGKLEGYAFSLKDAINALTASGRGGMLPVVALDDEACRLTGFMLMGEEELTVIERGVGQSLPVRFLHRESFVLTEAAPGLYDVQMEGTRLSVKCRMAGGKPHYVLTASANGYLHTAPSIGDRENGKALKQIQREIQESIVEEFVKIMETTVKGTGTDLFSLGKICSFRYPNQWKSIGKDWQANLQDVEYEIVAKVKIEDKRQVLGR